MLGAGAKTCTLVALGWGWPLQSFLGEEGIHVDAYMDLGPLRNVLTTFRAFASILTPGSGYPILLTPPPSSLGLSIATALRDLKLWGLIECPSPKPSH